MTRDDIIRMAREAGINGPEPARQGFKMYANPQRLERFAELVAAAVKQVDDDTIEYIQHMDAHIDTAVREAVAAEREACAKVAENRLLADASAKERTAHYTACKHIAAAIRARSDT